MIIAITGGTGFIGKHLIARHLALGDEVRYLTRSHERPTPEGAVSYKGDLNAPMNVLRPFLAGADIVYHCAAELRDEARMYRTNVEGTANLLAAADGNIKRWVQLSSTGVYGNPMNQDIDEDSTVNPVNAYEKSKASSDELLLTAADSQGLNCVIVRPSNVYGNAMPNQSLFQLIKAIDKGMFFFIGKAGAVTNYIHVENVVDALVLCGKADVPANGRVYIVSDYCQLEEFVNIVAAALDKKPSWLRFPEFMVRRLTTLGSQFVKLPLTSSRIDALTNRTIYHADRIKSELGYRHKISIEQGITELARFWKNKSN